MPRLLEIDLSKTCSQLLELDGWRALKTDPVSRREWGKGFGEAGMADYLYIRYSYQGSTIQSMRAQCEAMWIEWKIPTGRVAPKQHAWRERERSRGALSLIAGVDFHASIEGFARWYGQSGLERRKVRIGGERKDGR